jgi:hypothetical protein
VSAAPVKRRGRQGLGQPPFEPTREQRRFVAAMAGTRMTWDEMCQLVLNPRSGKPISKETLGKYFRQELDAGKAKLKAKVAGKWMDAIDKGEQWAVQFALRHICGYRDGEVSVNVGADGETRTSSIQIEFVRPRHRPDDD